MKLEKFTLTLMFLESSRSCGDGGGCSSNLNNVFQYIPIFLIANNNTSVHVRYSLEASTNFLLRDSSNSGVKKKTAEHYPYYRVLGRTNEKRTQQHTKETRK